VPCTELFPGPVSVKVEAVIVDEFIAWLKVAVTVVEMAAVVLRLSGVTEATAGGGAVAVVNVQM
jgi:hypothetical protein